MRNTQMEITMKVSFTIIKLMEKEFIAGVMGRSMMDSGIWEQKKGTVSGKEY